MITDEMVEAACRSIFPSFGSGHEATQDNTRRMVRAALEAAERVAWRPISEAPRDETVLVCVEPTEKNVSFRHKPPETFPAYINEDGRVFDCGTWLPDGGLEGEFWRSTHFRPLPTPLGAA